MKAEMYNRIEKHGKDLLAIFPVASERDPIKLCKKLFRLENKANRIATSYCNGDIDGEKWGKFAYETKKKLCSILGLPKGMDFYPFVVNGDPRGYALKIGSEHVFGNNWEICRDMGGYGIIAPDFAIGLIF